MNLEFCMTTGIQFKSSPKALILETLLEAWRSIDSGGHLIRFSKVSQHFSLLLGLKKT